MGLSCTQNLSIGTQINMVVMMNYLPMKYTGKRSSWFVKESIFGMRIFITKWLSSDIATDKVMVQRKQRNDSSGPIYEHSEEDTLRILKYQGEGVSEVG